jgi:hypothetical protein
LIAGAHSAQPFAPAVVLSESAPKSLTALDATAGASTPGARSSVDADDLSLLADLQAQA